MIRCMIMMGKPVLGMTYAEEDAGYEVVMF
jgi:hypothetical protein